MLFVSPAFSFSMYTNFSLIWDKAADTRALRAASDHYVDPESFCEVLFPDTARHRDQQKHDELVEHGSLHLYC